jgi:hypothetical protein
MSNPLQVVRGRRTTLVGLLLLAAAMIIPAAARAQAWLPSPGTGAIYVGYQYIQAHWTLFPIDITGVPFGPYVGEGERIAKGEHYGQIITVDLDYGIRKGLAMSVHVPYIESKYSGGDPHFPDGVDDGTYQGTLQDLGIGLHLMVLRKPFVATPFVRYLVPLQSYTSEGHAAAGKHLRALEVGAALARTLYPFLPDAYVAATYAYTAQERTVDHTMHINKIDMELGYFVTPRLSLKGAASYAEVRGGVEWDVAVTTTGEFTGGAEFIEYIAYHDRLANEQWWRVGGGAGYALTPRYLVYIYGFNTVSGENTHKTAALAIGFGWNFATPWAPEAPR